MSRLKWITPLLALLLAACQFPPYPSQSGAVLFRDDFSADGTGWDRYQDEVYQAGYANGSYQIELYRPNTDALSVPHLQFSDVQISVEAGKAAGVDDNLYGVVCRYQDRANFYFLVISSDGYAGIGVSKEGRRTLLSGDSLLPNPAIALGEARNQIIARCAGYELELIINGESIASSRAAEWQTGDVGLIAGTYDEPGTRIVFDNFTVQVP